MTIAVLVTCTSSIADRPPAPVTGSWQAPSAAAVTVNAPGEPPEVTVATVVPTFRQAGGTVNAPTLPAWLATKPWASPTPLKFKIAGARLTADFGEESVSGVTDGVVTAGSGVGMLRRAKTPLL